MIFTILGGKGFIGRNLATHLKAEGHEVSCAPRDVKQLAGKHLGHAVYAIGLTGDTRQRPHDAIEAHVSLLSWVLQNTTFDSFLYCSSTRIYGGMPVGVPVSENQPITLLPSGENLFDYSKLLGESLCQRVEQPNVRIARLANVYGQGQSKATFLGAVIDELQNTGEVTIHDSPDSVKDYVAVEDVNHILTRIILEGREKVYNVASGNNTKCSDIAVAMRGAGYQVHFSGKNPCRLFPPIDVTRIREEFGFEPRAFAADIARLLQPQ